MGLRTSNNPLGGASLNNMISLLEEIYPIGSIYISTNSTCPLATYFGTWTLVSSGKALWTGNGTNGASTISAGLPDIQATWAAGSGSSATGAASVSGTTPGESGGSGGQDAKVYFKASYYNSNIYGKSTTVQPPAYVVNVWRRTA